MNIKSNILYCPRCQKKRHISLCTRTEPLSNVVLFMEHLEDVTVKTDLDFILMCPSCSYSTPLPTKQLVRNRCSQEEFIDYMSEYADALYEYGQVYNCVGRLDKAYDSYVKAADIYKTYPSEANNEKWWKAISDAINLVNMNSEEEKLHWVRRTLDSIPDEYNGSGSLGAGTTYARYFPLWFQRVAHALYKRRQYKWAEHYQERALDYLCDLHYDFREETIDEAKAFMRTICSARKGYTYQGGHNIEEYDQKNEL